MQITKSTSISAVAAAMILALFVDSAPTSAGEIPPLVYDLDWNGLNTSYVDECLLNGSCFRLPIVGTIGVVLEAERPRLLNIDSFVVSIFAAPINTISDFAWQRLDWTIGEYLTDPQNSDLSMRFYPDPVLDTELPLYELFVDLTEGRSMLTLTGGGDGLADLPINTDSVTFTVSGRLIPEPNSALLAATAVIIGFANRRRR
jgi:hypothetical protein